MSRSFSDISVYVLSGFSFGPGRFFVAIPPSLRPAWGEQVTALTKPGGYLITVMFPIVPPHDEGPPFYVHTDHYATVLGERWERVIDEVPKQSIESHKGKERIMVWKRV